MPYRIGIDVGSKTIKLVALDERGDVAFHIYQRHRSNIRCTLTRVLDTFISRHGNLEGAIAVTGSAGISVAKMLGLPFVQEVMASTIAVRERFPQADTIVELGGEDAKVVYLSGRLEQRMNATCAGGTGGFIDTMASMLGVRTADINQLAKRANHEYPIASRCAVFAQTDVRPLLAAGVSKEDIAASALSAVVRQTLGGLACGRPLRGTVVFLGGPFEYIPELAIRFRRALDLDESTGIRPDKAHLITAAGAAIEAGSLCHDHPAPANVMSLSQLQQLVAQRDLPDDDLEHLPALFESGDERRAFDERHAAQRYPRERIFNCTGPLYLGFDAGSTTVKCALIDQAGKLVYHDYCSTEGNVLETALVMLARLYRSIPPSAGAYIAQSVVIGYGDALLNNALRIDSDAVETTAHLRAARQIEPDVSFVLDIGGQDMKALWVKNGQVVDAILNEACSSGCGSFIEGTAHALNMTRSSFAAAAMEASAPFDLGTKCTVFMTSRVRHAQKAGADVNDIAAGIAYSVVKNALFRVIGRDKSADMGDVVVVQGGAFKSDAVLRAFEKVSGVSVTRPDTAHLMGAIGAALIARDRAHDLELDAGDDNAYAMSNILDRTELERLAPRYSAMQCPGCANACMLSIVSFGDGRHFVSGNRCSSGQAIAEKRIAEGGMTVDAPDGEANDAPSSSALPRMRRRRKPRSRIEASFNPLSEATRDSIAASTGTTAAGDAGARTAAQASDESDITMIGVGLPLRDLEGDEDPDAQPTPTSNEEKLRNVKRVRIVPPKHANFEEGHSAFDYMAKTMHVSLTNLYCLNRTTRGAQDVEGDDSSPDTIGATKSNIAERYPVYRERAGTDTPAADVPNVVAFEQQLLASYGDVPATARRSATIGLPCTLSAYQQRPFWHTLLSELGFGVVVADDARSRAVRDAAAESVFSESVCEPAKITHARLFDLRRAKADAVLLPRYERGNRCPVMCGYADALMDNVEFLADGSVRAVAPVLRPTAPGRIASNELNVESIYESLRDLDPSAPLDRGEFEAALSRALAENAAFEERLRAKTEEALAWIAADERRGGIVVAGRPYHVDAALMHGIDGVVHDLGFAVISATGLAQRTAAIDIDAPWKPAKHLLKLAELVIANPALDLVILQSFNCGYDAISLGDVRETLTGAGRTFTALKIDEIVDTAHIRIRLRTMAEAIEARRRRERIIDSKRQSIGHDAMCSPTGETAERDGSAYGAASIQNSAPARISGEAAPTTPHASTRLRDTESPLTSPGLLDDGIAPRDLDTARSCAPADICFTAASLVAHAANVLREGHRPETLRVPQVCQSCMIDALPHLAGRVIGEVPNIAWEHTETEQLSPPTAALDAQPPDTTGPSRPVRIGIVGNPLLCFDEYMNENLASLLAELGAEPVWPDPAHLYVDDVRYFDQLDEFAEQGVDAVLYLQSFGCLKGHVQARGAANSMASRYPNMPVTVLDYDPESSALNRENRIRLAVAAARKA